MKSYRVGDASLKASGKIPPVVTKNGMPAFEVTYKKGTIGGSGSNMNAMLAPTAFFPTDQVRMKCKIMYEPGFPWGPDMKKSTGKIIGFSIGTGDASGGNYSETGATYRITWAFNGGTAPYLYPQVRDAHSKGANIALSDLDQSDEVNRVAIVEAGVHLFYPKDRRDAGAWDAKMIVGAWNDVEMFIKLNTPGKKDGILEMTVNGVRKRLSTVRYRYDKALINGVKAHTFFGGGSKDYAPPRDCKAWYADFSFSKT